MRLFKSQKIKNSMFAYIVSNSHSSKERLSLHEYCFPSFVLYASSLSLFFKFEQIWIQGRHEQRTLAAFGNTFRNIVFLVYNEFIANVNKITIHLFMNCQHIAWLNIFQRNQDDKNPTIKLIDNLPKSRKQFSQKIPFK